MCDADADADADGCSGRARIVADDISANIKHKLTKEQKKVSTMMTTIITTMTSAATVILVDCMQLQFASSDLPPPQAAVMEAREGRHEGWKDKFNKKGGGTTNLEKLKSKP